MKSKKHVTESPHQIMLSHSQREILAILKNRTWRRIGLLTHHSEEKRVSELCRKLEAEASHFIIPPLAAILIHFPIKLRPLLCQTFQRLLEKVSPDQWNFVDQEIRDELLALTYQIDPIKQTLPSPNLKDPSERLIALSHHSGFTRELAIAAIIPPITEATFSLLLLRCIDWAAPVAMTAQSKLSTFPTSFFENRINELLDTFFLIHRSTRPLSLKVQEQLEKIILSQPDWHQELISILEQGLDPNRMKIAAILLFRHIAQLPDELIPKLLTHGPPAQILTSLRKSQTLSPRRQDLVLEYTKTATAAPIRRERLRLLSRFNLKESQPDFEAALMEPSKSIRSVARFYLQEWTSEDFAKHYLRRLENCPTPRKFRAALTGLSEVAPHKAHSIALNLLTDAEHPAQLTTCILCLDLQSHDVDEMMILEWLQSPSISVAHTAFRQVIAQGFKLPEEELGTMINQATIPSHSRNFAMKLLNQTHKWNSLHWALKGAASDFPEVNEIARWKLRRWHSNYNDTAIHPTHEELKRITETFQSVQNHLGPKLSVDLQFLIKQL